jgi:hypothetical protein
LGRRKRRLLGGVAVLEIAKIHQLVVLTFS